MYIFVTLLSICIFGVIANGIRLSILSEPKQKVEKLSEEERLRQLYRNLYYSYLSLKDEV